MNEIVKINSIRQRTIAIGIVCLWALTPRTQAQDFEPVQNWGNHLFPSYIIATATMEKAKDDGTQSTDEAAIQSVGNDNSVLGVLIKAPNDNTKITVTVSAEGWLNPSSITTILPKKGISYRVMPTLNMRYSELIKNKQTIPTTVTYNVKLNGKMLPEQSKLAVLHSINDCPYSIVDGEESLEIGFVFAAFVNEQHPFIDKILREALDNQIVDSFTGYQSGSEAEVLRQVYAIWDSLASRDIRYSNITAVAGESQSVSSQHVRLFDESINNAQANCVDGSVLFASILRKIDIQPFLVFVPGHCYLAFALDEAGENIVGLETTMIGDASSEEEESDTEIDAIEELEELLDDETLELDSYASFIRALNYGTADLEENEESFNDENDGDYQMISIAEARARGILPIAFQSDTKLKRNR